jgi:hypothetical protein
VVRASPLGSDGKGLYSLELTDRGPQPEPGSLLIGSTARGTLTETTPPPMTTASSTPIGSR